MKNLRAILVDDEPIFRSRLRRMLEKMGGIEVTGECTDGPEAVTAIQEQQPDVVFLDVNMPEMNGFSVLDALGPEKQPTAVVFVTAYDEHAVHAFEACALDYLLKPTTPERLATAVARVRERVAATPGPGEGAADGTAPAVAATRFTVRSGGRFSFVSPQEIDWIEAAGNYAIFHVGPKNHMIRETMSGLEQKMTPEKFLRVSRSAIVNLRRVRELYASPAGEHAAILHDGQRVPVTRSLREVAEKLAAI